MGDVFGHPRGAVGDRPQGIAEDEVVGHPQREDDVEGMVGSANLGDLGAQIDDALGRLLDRGDHRGAEPLIVRVLAVDP